MLNKLALIVSGIVLSLFFYYIYTLNIMHKKDNIVKELDNGLLLAKNLLEEEQRYALAISTLISQDSKFLAAYYKNNRKEAFEIVNDKINNLSVLDGYPLEVQVHNKNAKTYLRSWDYNITNVALSSFREGVVLVKQTKKPFVSIEVGKRLNIKAISPILNKDVFEGSIEVIEGFKYLEDKLLEQGYTVFILLEKHYLNIATSLRNNQMIQNQFVLVNQHNENNILNKLKGTNLNSLGNYGYFTNEGISFGYFKLKNLHNKKIGYCILALKGQEFVKIQKHYLENNFKENNLGVIIR